VVKKKSANIPLAPAATSKARCGAIKEALRRAAGAGKASKVASRLLRSDSPRRGRRGSACRRKSAEDNCGRPGDGDCLKSDVLPGRLELFHRTLLRLFVGPPANDGRAVAETTTGKMVVRDFDDEPRRYRNPFGRSLRRPPAWRTGCFAGEAPLRPYLFKLVGQVPFLRRFYPGCETDMVQQALIVIKT
jgi:hypothetical protein